MQRGKFVIIGMVAVAIIMAGGAWWYRYHHSQPVMDLWGINETLLMQRAPEVQLYFLDPLADAEGMGQQDPSIWKSSHGIYRRSEPITLAGQRGFLHARQTLLEPISYDFQSADDDAHSANPTVQWQFQWVFRDGDQTLTICFAPAARRVGDQRGDVRATMTDVMDRIASYVERYRPVSEPPTAAPASEERK